MRALSYFYLIKINDTHGIPAGDALTCDQGVGVTLTTYPARNIDVIPAIAAF